MKTTTTSRTLLVDVGGPAAPCCDGPAVTPSLSPARTETLADRLKALADPTRLRMLEMLMEETDPLCVCHITEQFPQNQPTISHHLRILREAGFITCEKRGVWAYYWATDEGRRALSLAVALL